MTAFLSTERIMGSRRARRIALEVLFGVGTALVLLYLVVQALDLRIGYGYLSAPTGFQISHEWLTDFSASQSRRDAFLVAAWNTIRLVFVGIILATLLGVTVGVARLSTNWLVRSLATLFVEIIRNTPLLVQIIFWYFAVFLTLPRIEDGIDLGGVVFLSNRGLVIPSVSGGSLAWVFALAVVIAGRRLRTAPAIPDLGIATAWSRSPRSLWWPTSQPVCPSTSSWVSHRRSPGERFATKAGSR